MPKRRKKRRISLEFDDVTDAELDSKMPTARSPSKLPNVNKKRRRQKKQTTLAAAFGLKPKPVSSPDFTITPEIITPSAKPTLMPCIEGMMEQGDLNFHNAQSDQLRAQIMKYKRDSGQPWLAIVVGPPGCGKSFTVKQALRGYKVCHVHSLHEDFTQHMKEAIYPTYSLTGPVVPTVAVIENVDTLPVNEFNRIFQFLKVANHIPMRGSKKRKRKPGFSRPTNFVVMTCINKYASQIWPILKPQTFLAQKINAVTVELKPLNYVQHMCVGRRVCSMRGLPSPKNSPFIKESIEAITRACDLDTAKFLSMMETMCLDLEVRKHRILHEDFRAGEQRKDFQPSLNIFAHAKKLLQPSELGPEHPGIMRPEDDVSTNCQRSFADFVMERKRVREATDEKEQYRRQQAVLTVYNQPQVIGPYTALWERGGEKMHHLVYSNYPSYAAMRMGQKYVGGDHVYRIAKAYSDWDAVDYSAKTHLDLVAKLTCRHTFEQVKFCEARGHKGKPLKLGHLFNASLPVRCNVTAGYSPGEWEMLQHVAIMEKIQHERKAQDLTQEEDPDMKKYKLDRQMNCRWTLSDQGYTRVKEEDTLTSKRRSELERHRIKAKKALRWKMPTDSLKRLQKWKEEHKLFVY